MRTHLVSSGCAVVLLLLSTLVWAEEPRRTGLTVEGGWGVGYTATIQGARAVEGDIDATSVGFGVGGFVHPTLALLARVGPSHGYSVVRRNRIVRVTQSPIAGVVQWFPHPRWMLAGGGAFVVRTVDDATAAGTDTTTDRGFGAILRVGHGFANWRTLGMRLTLEIMGTRYGEGALVSSALGFEVQSF